MKREFPDTAPFTSDYLQCNNYWIFALGRVGESEGRLFFRPNTEISGIDGEWKLFGRSGRPVDAFPRDRDREIQRLDMDNDVLLAIAEGGFVYRVLDTFEQDPEKFHWRKAWGWPFDFGPQMVVRRGYRELCFSSSKEWSTLWTSDGDGNRHSRFIDHMYCLSDRDTLIHHNDPWTPGDWDYAFTTPESGRLLPARGSVPGYTSGINASGGVLGFISPKGIWTIEYDFDIAGGNPLAEYVPHKLPPYEGIAPISRLEKGSKPIRFPSAPWRSHGRLPGPCTAHLQVSPQWDAKGKVVPGPESRTIRVLGLRDMPRTGDVSGLQPGYWEKCLIDDEWRFVPWSGVRAEEILENVINGKDPEYGPELRSDWIDGKTYRGTGVRVSLEGFGPHSNFIEPARFTLTRGEESLVCDFYAHIQMRTSRTGRAVACLRGRRHASWLGAFLLYPEDDSPLAAVLVRLCGGEKGDSYARLIIKMGKRRVELIKPLIPLNADITNAINGLFGKRVAILRKTRQHE